MEGVTYLSDICTNLVLLGTDMVLSDGTHFSVRNLDNTPSTVNLGDFPIAFLHPRKWDVTHMSFLDADGSSKGRYDFEVGVYFLDSSEVGTPIWESRPRVVSFIENFIENLRNSPLFDNATIHAEARCAGPREDVVYNKVMYRGTEVRVYGFLFVG